MGATLPDRSESGLSAFWKEFRKWRNSDKNAHDNGPNFCEECGATVPVLMYCGWFSDFPPVFHGFLNLSVATGVNSPKNPSVAAGVIIPTEIRKNPSVAMRRAQDPEKRKFSVAT